MKLKYLFMAMITSLVFVACASDDDALGTLDDIQISETYVTIPEGGGSATVTIKSAYDWNFQSNLVKQDDGNCYIKSKDKNGEDKYDLCWYNISNIAGTDGETEITITAPAFNGGREVTLYINAGASTQFINIRQGDMKAEQATCAEVIAGPDSKTYRVKGTVTAIANTTYGNWYLNDGTGEIYIYGTLDKNGQEKNFASLGIEAGDVVEVEGPKTTYNSTIELVNVTVIKITKSMIKCVSEEQTVGKDGGPLEVKVAYKGKGAFLTVDDDCADWVKYKETETIAGVPTKLEKNPADTAVFKLNVMPNAGGARKGTLSFKSGSSSVSYTFSQEGSIVPVSCAEFNAAPVGDAQYRLLGLVTEVKSEKFGNIYVQDYTGQVYVYGTANYADYPVKAGDVVNIVGPRGEYKGNPQMVNGTIDELCASAEPISLADFNAAEDSNDKYYVLTGKITEIANDKYGNVYIEDATGEKVYLYGVYGDWTGENKQFFLGDNGIAVGDTITVVTIKTSFKGAAQGKNAVCFGVKKAE